MNVWMNECTAVKKSLRNVWKILIGISKNIFFYITKNTNNKSRKVIRNTITNTFGKQAKRKKSKRKI